jgi:tetratricopeptide (TPR) repeat protein
MPESDAEETPAAADGAVVTKIGAASTAMGKPYPGARPFQQADHDRFFGRTAQADALAELWRANRLTVAVGAAASGKTSLLNAGVFPLIANERADVLLPGSLSYGGTFPFAALPEHNPYTLALLRSWSPDERVTRLVGRTVRDFIRSRAERHGGGVLAAIDQVEEVAVASGSRLKNRRLFFAELAQAIKEEPRLHVLLVVREEAASLVSDAVGPGARHQVPALTAQEAVEAVTGPVAGELRSYDDGVAEAIVSDLQTSRLTPLGGGEHYVVDDHVEPAVLQVVCARLWDALPADTKLITRREMRRYGDVDAALASHYGRIIAAVAEDHDLPVTRLRSWLQGTFITELGTRGTAYEGATATAGMPNAVALALEDRHLLTAERRSGARWYELLSDRLIEPLRQTADERPPSTDPAGYLRAAGRALALGDLDLAERYAQETVRGSPDTDLRLLAEVSSLLGNLARERGKPKEAEDRYRKAASLYEAVRDTEAVARQLAAVGQTLIAQGEFISAVGELRSALERMPSDLIVQTELAMALWHLGEGRGAVAVLTAVLENDGGNVAALQARGEILADLGEARDALLDLDRVASHPRPLTRAARGLALAELGDFPAAEREIDDAVTDAPRNGPVLWYAARVCALGGDNAEAAELARQAVDATDPVLSPPHHEAARRLISQEQAGAQLTSP